MKEMIKFIKNHLKEKGVFSELSKVDNSRETVQQWTGAFVDWKYSMNVCNETHNEVGSR